MEEVVKSNSLGRLLLTGATGFIGTALAHSLSESGWKVVAVLRHGSDDRSIDSRVERVRHDGTTEGLHRIVSGGAPDVVVHAATRFVGQHAHTDIAGLIESNLLFGTQLLDAMARCNVRRLVNFGTGWQHFAGDAYEPATLYAATKQAFEDLLLYYVKAEHFSSVTLKLSDTYGPADKRKKLVAMLADAARTGAGLAMSPGDQRLNMLHVNDATRGVDVAIDRVRAADPGTAENFALRGSETISLRDFVACFEKATGLSVPVDWGARPYREREVMEPWLGPLLPGWAAEIPIERGLRDIFAEVKP